MDEGSANGVIVNGVRITAPTPVNQMSRIEVAEFRLAVEPLGPRGASAAVVVPQPPPPGAPPVLSGMMQTDVVRLIAEGGPYDGRVFELPPLQEIAVGRAVDNDLVLDDPSLSRKHARLRRLGGGRLEVEDTHSANGTYVNGRKVDRAQLVPGDTLRFGELMFRIDGGGLMPPGPPDVVRAPAASARTKAAFFGLLGMTVLVYGVWMWKAFGQPQAPQRGQIEEALSGYVKRAEPLVQSAKDELAKKNWARAKEEAEKALDIDPANLEAVRTKGQAVRGETDQQLYKKAATDMETGTPESLRSAVLSFHTMSPDSPYRQDLGEKLSNRLHQFGIDLYGRKQYREAATTLCDAYRVAPARSGRQFVAKLRDAERKARITATCPVR
jgi:pSer/pThr/pTyr-binding forkhead associated (FHA) protein